MKGSASPRHDTTKEARPARNHSTTGPVSVRGGAVDPEPTGNRRGAGRQAGRQETHFYRTREERRGVTLSLSLLGLELGRVNVVVTQATNACLLPRAKRKARASPSLDSLSVRLYCTGLVQLTGLCREHPRGAAAEGARRSTRDGALRQGGLDHDQAGRTRTTKGPSTAAGSLTRGRARQGRKGRNNDDSKGNLHSRDGCLGLELY